jgi:hypothetical protein
VASEEKKITSTQKKQHGKIKQDQHPQKKLYFCLDSFFFLVSVLPPKVAMHTDQNLPAPKTTDTKQLAWQEQQWDSSINLAKRSKAL